MHMRFHNVSIAGLSYIDPPHRITAEEIQARLKPAFDRFGSRPDLLQAVAGINAKRLWDVGTQPSDGATAAAEKALLSSGVDRTKIGVLINTSVCRDYLEPSTACIVHGNLGLADTCQNFDVGNACLAFINGMNIVGGMIERGEIDYGMIVNGEDAGPITESTIQRMLDPSIDEATFRSQFASLTLGSGAVAMVMGRSDLVPDGHRFLGSVTRAATQWNKLCVGHMDRMYTDTKTLLVEGLKLAAKTYQAARGLLGWAVEEMDQFVIHQVSRVHTEELVRMLGIDPSKVHTIFPEMGNIGPASVPIVLAKIAEMGKLKKGDRIALLGIGSGLNCSMGEVIW